MKNFKALSLMVAVTLVFSSCSSSESLELDNSSSSKLLKSYTLKRDANGAYSVDFDVNNNVKTEKIKDLATNTNQFYLYNSNSKEQTKLTQNLTIDGEQLKVGFIDTQSSNKNLSIAVTDDNITLAKGNSNLKLKDYSISSNNDGTFNLDFVVKNNVGVDFVYDNENSIYEVHLENAKGVTTTNYSKLLEKEEGKPLKLDFVNHLGNTASKGEESEALIRKPRVVIDF